MRPLQNLTGAIAGLEAHREMKKRILSAVVLVPLLLITVYTLPKIVTVIALGLLAAIAAFELLYNTGYLKHFRMVIYAMVFAALVPVWCYCGESVLWGRLGLLTFFCLMFMEMMLSGMKLRFEKCAACMAAGLLIPYLLASITRILTPIGGRYVVLIPFVLAFLSDSGAYFIGCRFGKHKLAPTISPKKSIEGMLGGMACAVLGMLLYCLVLDLAFSCDVNYGFAFTYGVLGSLGGVFGDLCFSVIKRQTGIKDYGNLIPGHGGVLDRFDSLLVVGPLTEILLILLPVVVK